MKYTVALVAFAAGALAQSSSNTITSAPAATSASLTPQLSCVATCASGDVTCQAACLGIARPNASQAIETNECAAKCDQGDGSAEATQKYADCQQACFASLFPSSQTAFGAGGAAAGGSSSTGTASAGAAATNSVGSVVTSRTSSAASGATRTSSGTAGSASSSGTAAANAANTNSVKMVGAGLAGFMAIFAL